MHLLAKRAERGRGKFALLRLGEGTIGLLKTDVSKWPSASRGAIHGRAVGYPYDSSRGKAAPRGRREKLERML
jgi:hypothetical protein